jgi:hypothetical protein
MTQELPRYCDNWEGKIIKLLIVHDGPVFFDTLLEKTGLTAYALRDALHTLFYNKIISKDESDNRYLLIDEEIRKEWQNYLGTNNPKAPVLKQDSPPILIETNQVAQANLLTNENSLVKWIVQWKDIRNLSLPIEANHFFLEGEYLDELSMVLIGQAQEEILVTNPYIDSCHLTKALSDAVGKKIRVRVVARKPTIDEETKRKCQAELIKEGMQIHYDNQIHSKLIVIDNKVAIVSSMNLYSGSSGGFTKEAGIVSIEEKVVKSVAEYILNLLEKSEQTTFISN